MVARMFQCVLFLFRLCGFMFYVVVCELLLHVCKLPPCNSVFVFRAQSTLSLQRSHMAHSLRSQLAPPKIANAHGHASTHQCALTASVGSCLWVAFCFVFQVVPGESCACVAVTVALSDAVYSSYERLGKTCLQVSWCISSIIAKLWVRCITFPITFYGPYFWVISYMAGT